MVIIYVTIPFFYIITFTVDEADAVYKKASKKKVYTDGIGLL